MGAFQFVSILIIIITVFTSYRGFQNIEFFSKNVFEVEKVVLYRQYWRLITSGFIHVNWLHLIFNMLSLFFFGGGLEAELTAIGFLVVYFGGLVGGNLISLILHRKDGDYSSLGASGAVSAVIFAAIAISPGMRIGLFILPAIPAWIYGILFLGFSMYGIQSKRDNIGHESHLGGALSGMMIALLMRPSALMTNTWVIILLVVPSLVFIYLIMYRPGALMINNLFYKRHALTVDDKFNLQRFNRQQEVDRILEKIHKRGMNSLSRQERDFLEKYSRR